MRVSAAWIVGLLYGIGGMAVSSSVGLVSPLPIFLLEEAGRSWGNNLIVVHDVILYVGVALPFAILIRFLSPRRFRLIVAIGTALYVATLIGSLVAINELPSDWRLYIRWVIASFALPLAALIVNSLGVARPSESRRWAEKP